MSRHAVTLAALFLAACSDPPAPTASAPVPRVAEAPAPPAYAPWQWNDVALDPQLIGRWMYTPLQGGYSTAAFGGEATEAAFSLSCEHATRTVTIMRSNQLEPDQPTTITLIIPAGRQDFAAQSYNEGLPHIAARVPIPDARLEAVAASQDGFAVEAGGDVTRIRHDPMLARVLADCGRS